MAKFLSKHLGKVALMTAAALWASCSDAKEEKIDRPVVEKSQASQTEDFKDTLKDIGKKAKSKYLPSQEMDTTGVTALYGCANCGKKIIEIKTFASSAECLYGTCSGGDVEAKSNAVVTIPGEPDIEITGEISNAKPHVLKVVQARTPGLRHIYRKHLKKKTGFNGTVILNLKINANGDVENVVTKSSTTSYQEFDAEIVKAVSRWKFSKSKTGGNMTIPFNFQEYGPTPSKEN